MSKQPQEAPPERKKPANPPSSLSLRLIPEKWCTAWSEDDVSHWISLHSPTATYTDHAFRQVHTTPTSLTQHFITRRAANQDFKVTLHPNSPVYWSDNIVEETTRAMFRTVCEGMITADSDTQMNDEANRKRFRFEGVVELLIGKGDGLVWRVEEWYSRDFDKYGVEDGYVIL